MSNTIELMLLVHKTVVRCILLDVLWYVWPTSMWLRHAKVQKSKSYTLKLKSEAGKPSVSSRSGVSDTSRVCNRSLASDSIVL